MDRFQSTHKDWHQPSGSDEEEMMSLRVQHAILVALLLQLYVYEINGFANNLVTSSIGCMTDLDVSEVIMNNVVKSAEDSPFPRMHLAVDVDSNHMESPYHYSAEDLTIVFVNPYTRSEFPEDLQFVIQLEGDGAEFVGGGSIGCEGNRRVSARLRDENGAVQLQIHDTSASFKLWAGWATGHSAVSLTPELILEPRPLDAKAPDTVEEKEEKEEKQEKDREVPKAKAVKSAPRRSGPKEKATDRALKSSHKSSKKSKVPPKDSGAVKERKERAKKEKVRGEREDTLAREPRGNQPATKRRHAFDEEAVREKVAADLERNFPDERSLRYRYQRGVQLDTSSHVLASLFVLASLGIVYYTLGKRKEKGRRDL